jgi:predicted nucleotidyltransferase
MKTSLDFLPHTKKEQIIKIVEVINAIVEVEKIILYGSYAKGTFQEDNHIKDGTLYEYLSDYDILVVLKNKVLEEYLIQDRIVNTINYKAPLNILISYIDQVNEGLEKGQYFFTEIIETGIMLFDQKGTSFVKPKVLTSAERKEKALQDFDFYYNNGLQFLLSASTLLNNAIKQEIKPNLVPHQLHQAVESFYSAVLLVFTGYKPKIHNLDKYRKQIKSISGVVLKVFPYPTNDTNEVELFSLLKRAYIGGKYKKDFEIDFGKLCQLIDRVITLKSIVKELCLEKINSF